MLEKRFCILVVDDDPLNVRLLTSVLKDEYDVFVAYSGYEAIGRLGELKPDLILLDVMMPEMDGFDVCRIVKVDPAFADIPVLFLTSMDADEGEMLGLEAGGVEYLSKPVNFELLKLRVRNLLELKKQINLVTQQRDLMAAQKKQLSVALARVKQLEGLIHICMYCKDIRNELDIWERLENYVEKNTDALFSHGVCPSCRADLPG